MDYEKKYNEALERAQKVTRAGGDVAVVIVQDIFPELAESEDERIRTGLIRHLKELRDWKVGTMSPIKVSSHYDAWIAYLEKQKEQKPADLSEMMVHKEPYIAPVPTPMVADEQKPAEWSEEDEKKMIFLERLIEYNVPDGQYGWADGRKGGFVTKSEAISMLKSLRPVSKESLQPHWKPSEEQMRCLDMVLCDEAMDDNVHRVLVQLREQLKKLMSL